MRTFTIYVMVGVPGSGKSTWIKKNLGENFPVVSRDLIREDLGYAAKGEKILGTREQEEAVTKIQNRKIKWFLNRGISFAIDDTNLGKYLSELIETLRESSKKPKIIGVIMKTPLFIASKRRPGIPFSVLSGMKKNQISLDLSLFDKVIFSKGV